MASLDKTAWPAMAYSRTAPPVECRTPEEFARLPKGYGLGLAAYRASLELDEPDPAVTEPTEPAPPVRLKDRGKR